MFTKIKEKYYLSDAEAILIKKGILFNALSNISKMLPVGICAYVLSQMYSIITNKTNSGELPIVMYSISEFLRKLPLAFFAKRDISDLTTIVMTDTSGIEHALAHVIPQCYGTVLSTAVIFLSMLIFDFKMAMSLFWVIPIAFAVVLLSRKLQKSHSEKFKSEKLASSDQIQTTLEMIKEIKSFSLEEKQKIQAYIETGNILHALFASIRNSEDIDKAIDQLEFDGVLYNKPMTRQELRNYIDRALENKQIAEWFSSKWKVFNECSILYYDEEHGQVRERRPDRVIYDGKQMTVIDFKTGKQLERHQEQVRQYMNLLYDMGYQNISGYLWYIQNNNIVKVSL